MIITLKRNNIILVLALCLMASELISQTKVISNTTDVINWQFESGAAFYASPVVQNEIIYIGSLDSNFYAIDANNGNELWKYSLPTQVRSTAIVVNNKVVFESANVLYALSLTGELLWETKLYPEPINNEMDPWDFRHSSPVLHNNVIYIGTVEGFVLGLNSENGNEVFKCQTLNKDLIKTTPVISDDKIYFGDWNGVMYACNIENSKIVWQYDTKNDTIYPWRNTIQTTPVIAENSLYFGGRSSRLYSLDKNTGKKNWMHASPTNQWLVGGMVINDGVIYLGSSDQKLFHAFNVKTGELKWTVDTDCRTWGTALIHNNAIYFGSRSVYKVDKATGKIKTQVKFDQFHDDKNFGSYVDRRANFHSSPALFKTNIIIGHDNGVLYSLKIE